jgi:hypothetical protein
MRAKKLSNKLMKAKYESDIKFDILTPTSSEININVFHQLYHLKCGKIQIINVASLSS